MDAAAAARGVSRSEYLRSCATSGADQKPYLTGADKAQIGVLVKQVRKVGQNLNALVRCLNTGGSISERVTPGQVAGMCREIESDLVAPIAKFIEHRLPKMAVVEPEDQHPGVPSSQQRFSRIVPAPTSRE